MLMSTKFRVVFIASSIFLLLGQLSCRTTGRTLRKKKNDFIKIKDIKDKELILLREDVETSIRIFPAVGGREIKLHSSVENFLKQYEKYVNIEKGFTLSLKLDSSISEWKRRIPVHVDKEIEMSTLKKIIEIARQIKVKVSIYKKTKYYDNVKKPITHFKIILFDNNNHVEEINLYEPEYLDFLDNTSRNSLQFLGIIPHGKRVFPVGMYISIQFKYFLKSAHLARISVYGKDKNGNRLGFPSDSYMGHMLNNNKINNYKLTVPFEVKLKYLIMEITLFNEKGERIGHHNHSRQVDIEFKKNPPIKGKIWKVELKN